jgi:tetratricopeptide (TPR) repeat protein
MTTESGPPADVQLDTLEAKGLIRLATLRPELEYLFRHALVQDAAYGSLLKQERRELHGRVGEALESLYPERKDELAPVLAMHFEQAGETEKAIDYFAAGAQHALRQNAIQEAYGAFDQAAALIDKEAVDPSLGDAEVARRRRRRAEVEVGRAEAGYSFLAPEDSFDRLERALPGLEELADPELELRAHMLIALGRMQNGEAPTAPMVQRSLDRMVAIGLEIGDPTVKALPLAVIGLTKVFNGPVREGVAAIEEALPLMEGRDDSIGSAFARGALAIGYATLGEFDKAKEAADDASAIAEKRGDLIAKLDALIAQSMLQSLRGDLDRAVPIAQECVEKAEETGASACMVVSSWILGDAFHRQGRFEEAHEVLKRGSDVSLVVDRKVWRPTLQAWLGGAAAALGEVGEANWSEALETARSIDNRMGQAGILVKRGEARASAGDFDAAAADIDAAIAIYEDEGARPLIARVLFMWGSLLRRAGRTDDAAGPLERAERLFTEVGLDGEASKVRTERSLGATTLTFDQG